MIGDALRAMLAALREIYDGYWSREIGAEGGRQLYWEGKAGLIGGVTPAIDRHHAVMAEMGERLLLHRFPLADSEDARQTVEEAIGNNKELEQMRAELRAAVSGLFAGLGKELYSRPISLEEREQLIDVAMVVARGRAAVYRERGELVDVGAPEIPSRLGQQLERLLAGMDAIEVERPQALSSMLATALTSMPAERLRALIQLHDHGVQTTSQVRVALDRPTKSIHRTLEDVTAHGLVKCTSGGDGKADSWELTELTKWTLGDLPDDVLSYVVGAKAASDVAPPQGVGDSWRAPEDYLARDPRGSAEPRRHADNGALEDGVPTLSCPTCGAAKAVDKVRAGITYLACGHHVVVKAAP